MSKLREFLLFAMGGMINLFASSIPIEVDIQSSTYGIDGIDYRTIELGVYPLKRKTYAEMDEQTRLFVDRVNSIAAPPLEMMSVEEARQLGSRRSVAGVIGTPLIELGSVFNITIPSFEAEVPLRIYVPKGQGPFPVFIFAHGGGWVLGSLDSHDLFCRNIAEQAGIMVVSIDYRLAPEYKYPAGLNDCCAAVNWIANHIQEWGGNPLNLAIGGFSAGGNLAAAVALKAKEGKFPIFQAQVLICPVTNHGFETLSYQQYAEGYLLTKKQMEWFWSLYLEKASDGQDPYASPLKAHDVSGLPSSLVVLAELDPLYDEGLAYGEKMKAAGVYVTIQSYPTVHVFISKEKELDISKKAISNIARFLRNRLYES